MVKIKFELNIDEVVECNGAVCSDNEVFKNPEATGKTFLFIDRLTGTMQAAFCKEAVSETNKYANVEWYPLPHNTVIVDEDTKDINNEDLLKHIQDCYDKVCSTLQTYHRIGCEHHDCVMKVVNDIRSDIGEGSTGNGISEKTLLEALKIVSKKTE